ncbi:MAG TPA: chemotaxis protein CheD [Thermoanaerobaculia bacterium]|nr:chemotaxis protein CheD [Thermoanaerobaculia bacterium]
MSERDFEAEDGAPQVRTRERIYVPPGGFSIARTPTAISTILGSCVSVCLWDAEAQIGGLNHFLLPHWAEGGGASWRYGNAAIDGLIDAVVASGAREANLQAKVFGGARVLAAFAGNGNHGGAGHLGGRNVEVAQQTLKRRAIPIVAEAVGGERGRKLIFHTDDGSAWVKLL